jgi:hypothetical protein
MSRDCKVLVVGLIAVLLVSLTAVAQAAAESDAEIESCLTNGKILKGAEELVGITRPLKVEVECNGAKREAMFKSVDEHKPGSTRLASGEVEFNFSDSFRYERAAYLLDRQLGLDMVPVAVLARRKGSDGILVDWIPNSVHENKVTVSFDGPQMASQFRQKSRMRMFDSLIYNTDRRAENIMVDESTAKVYLIDHSRAFREKEELQDEFAQGRVWLSREIYDNLVGLDAESLAELSDGLISKRQLEALLVRRDLIVAKIDADRQEYGDEAVFVAPAE